MAVSPGSARCPDLVEVALPALREGAARPRRPPHPALIGHVPVAISEDRAAVRAAAQELIGPYARAPFYARMFADAGFPSTADGKMTEPLIDDWSSVATPRSPGACAPSAPRASARVAHHGPRRRRSGRGGRRGRRDAGGALGRRRSSAAHAGRNRPCQRGRRRESAPAGPDHAPARMAAPSASPSGATRPAGRSSCSMAHPALA